MLGLELLDSRVIAVIVGLDGTIGKRTSVAGADLSVAATTAIEQIGGTPAGADGVGVAMLTESAAATALIDDLAKRFPGLDRARPVLSGRAAAVAEAWIGAASGATDVAFFSAAEHVTAGVIHDGVPVTGARGRAGSIAWLGLNPVSREDYRKLGCVEAEVGAAGTVRRLIWRIKAGDQSRVQDIVNNDLSAITIDHLLDAARQGDGVCISVVRDTAKYLGMAAANLAAIVDPEALVLGGVIASAPDLLLEPVRSEIVRRLPRAMSETLTIVPAALGADAAAIGAARLAAQARR